MSHYEIAHFFAAARANEPKSGRIASVNIFLIGYRATGKTSVGRLLTQRLGEGWKFVDIDREIEKRAGADIAEIFRTQGEPAFRHIEAEIMRELGHGNQQVVALGGGTLGRGENRDVAHCGWCAWLTASPATIHARMLADPATAATRPNLTPLGGLAEIEHVLADREPIYRELADFVADTEHSSIEEVTLQVEAAYHQDESELSGESF